MFTRCPQCKTVHALNAALLAYAHGSVQCGGCNKSFDALSFLFDDWPDGKAHQPAEGVKSPPPVLGNPVSKFKPIDQTDPDDDSNADKDSRAGRMLWVSLMLVLIVLTIANATWTFREPLKNVPEISDWLNEKGWLQTEQDGMLKDPGQIQLVSRDMHVHPSRTGILILSLTFVNLATRQQVFPVLEVTLLDAAGQSIASRRFKPIEYLRPGADRQAGLGSEVYLPVLLELGDPGQQAVGFEIDFR